ncbi:hydroxyacid oxidase 1-like [Acanthaster planci]|uniref:(S)-2-hydroxy-acid oxidase n=1 Tax=Acanthaster planci TaxID=133434 RepID=A0A8B7YFC1_ACAPL|nr:hydroxyacid oxidase 1-like [Acanthaster planci]
MGRTTFDSFWNTSTGFTAASVFTMEQERSTSHHIQSFLHKHGIRVFHTAPLQTLHNLLTSHKDQRQNPHRRPGVYRIPCQCGKVYIGETGRDLPTLLNEHKAHGRKGELEKSSIIKHSHTEDHQINWSQAELITSIGRWYPRRIEKPWKSSSMTQFPKTSASASAISGTPSSQPSSMGLLYPRTPQYRLRPRVLRDVSHRDMRTTLLGQEIAFPVAVAPTAAHCFAHIEGELATARAAKATGTGMVLSSGTTSTMEDVAAASSPNGLLWVQLQIFRDFDIVRSIIMKAEKLGYRALVVTIDCSVPRRTSRRSLKLPPGKGLAHFPGVDMSSFGANITNDSVTWKDIDLLHSITSLPVVLKGILTEEDAREALKHDIAGIIVSNHGGRNLDGTLATIDALAEVVEAVRGSNIEVYLDGGVRRGTDVLKALALGARAVFIGRPVLWGLAYDGEGGVRKVLEMIRDEFSLAMALSGCRSVGDITPDLVVKQTSFSANL